jgi:hypothetical protein
LQASILSNAICDHRASEFDFHEPGFIPVLRPRSTRICFQTGFHCALYGTIHAFTARKQEFFRVISFATVFENRKVPIIQHAAEFEAANGAQFFVFEAVEIRESPSETNEIAVT